MAVSENLEELSKKVNEVLNYVSEYRKRNIKANGNDMMVLYKIVSEYEQKIKGYMSRTSDITDTNNQAQYMDLVARRADAHENKRIIAEAIAKSMQENAFDAIDYKKRLSKLLSTRDQNKKDVKNLFDALTEYDKAMKDSSGKNIFGKADAKVKLVNACIGYVKNFRGNSDALNTVYDIAAVMGAQNVEAFNGLTNEQMNSLPAKKHIGFKYKDKPGFGTHHMDLNFVSNSAPEEVHNLVDNIAGKTQEEKEAAYDEYLNYMYGSDRNAKHKNMDQTLKEMDPNASERDRYIKLGEKISEKMPWHNLKLDNSVTSKEKFTHRQEVMRQWFPDDTALLFGATAEKNTARSFLNELSNQTYNGFFRSFYNSPEYTDLMKSLYAYTQKLETNPIQDEANLEAVKKACNTYLQHYEDKDAKKKTAFAKMRRDKVRRLLVAIGGNEEVITKEEKLTDKVVEPKKALFKDNAQFKKLLVAQENKFSSSTEAVIAPVNSGKNPEPRDLARVFVERGLLNHLKSLEQKEYDSDTCKVTANRLKNTNYERQIDKIVVDPVFKKMSKELIPGECSVEAINKLFVKFVKVSNRSETDVVEKTTQTPAEFKKELKSEGWGIK